MPNALTPARLRELIAAATPGPWGRPTDEGNHLAVCIEHPETGHQCIADFPYRNINYEDDAQLVRYLVNHAPALADALEKAELLEWALDEGLVSQMQRDEWGDWIERSIVSIDAPRAAKEAANEVEN